MVASPGPKDRYQNATTVWADPVPVAVYGWAPKAMTEPGRPMRDEVISVMELFAPGGTVSNPPDRWILDDVMFEAVAHASDYTHSPFPLPGVGVVIELRRVEG